ncbi:DUF2163 domain-containing protein [Rhodobacteraceae bacterium]|nr:DUF2163 domain-containing protein [Paracoccaceae bacterium]
MTTLVEHLDQKVTTICRVWALTRRDGVVMGFTDHDRPLAFDGIEFNASTGMSARALEQTTGLAVDNTEAVGALTDVAIREDDVRAGLFDGARIQAWHVNWRDVDARALVFRGRLGEIERQGKNFRAELRGLTDQLNRPQGRVYQQPCAAVLGDGDCRFDTGLSGFSVEAVVVSVADGVELRLPGQSGLDEGWFQRGRLTVMDGAAAGAVGVVKRDREIAGQRVVELWEILSPAFSPGDRVRLEAGCDKRAATCRDKFSNFLNFRGFPTIPGEDWLVSYPVRGGANDGGSLSA